MDWQQVENKGKKAKKAYDSGRLQGNVQAKAGKKQEQLRQVLPFHYSILSASHLFLFCFQYFDEKLPASDEVKDRLIERLKALITETQKNPEYTSSIQTIVDLVQKWYSKSQTVIQNAADGTKVEDDDQHAQEAYNQLKAILESFAGGKSLDGLINTASKVNMKSRLHFQHAHTEL